jgi:hypothetical protein
MNLDCSEPRYNHPGTVLSTEGRRGPFPLNSVVNMMVEPKRKKPDRSKRTEPIRETVVALKGSAEWKTWLDGFANHCRLGLADTMEQSLVYYAKERGYEIPPKR